MKLAPTECYGEQFLFYQQGPAERREPRRGNVTRLQGRTDSVGICRESGWHKLEVSDIRHCIETEGETHYRLTYHLT